MATIKCERCGKEHFDGMTGYEITISVRSTFDGVIPEQDEMDKDKMVEEIMADLDSMDDSDILSQVFEDHCFFICLKCKKGLLEKIKQEFAYFQSTAAKVDTSAIH